MIKVTAPDSHFLPGYLSGKWWAMITLAATRGFIVRRLSDGSVLEFTDGSYLDLSSFLASATDGFTVENWPCFLSLSSAKYNDDVPYGIPDRIITDADGSETVKTWAEWGSSDHVDLTDGTKGIPLVYNHTACTNVECSVLSDMAGYTLIDTASYRDLLPDGGGL